ncbi:hypothetical protein F1D05_05240 [Kribbella qitaiheensis]|uniref:Uncharacterized protein n=1 Tax=Kribbella qitaiheensis TaxID=1544730 RepID=A0A7G6WTW8_9ACTN|nr:site-specific integrase [Kribbella qitaiheensis]QNE17433.1 hypothetical protein F1D05_05240 [Kribbella qitaiheensis]
MWVQRVAPVGAGEESWTVLGDDWRQVVPDEQFLSHLTDQRRSPNTVKAYAHDLKDCKFQPDKQVPSEFREI